MGASVKPKERVAAAHIRSALRDRFHAPECAIAFEVAAGTGHLARRRLDAVAMELWPSRGLALHGIEIKVSRNDFRREARDPEKAEEIARFCDLFWIAAPPEIVPIDELPMAWGLMEYRGGRLVVVKQAKATPAEPVDRNFLAALFRAAADRMMPEDERDALLERERAEQRERFQKEVSQAARKMVGDNSEAADNWRKLMAAIGEGGARWVFSTEVIEAFKFVKETKIAGSYSGVTHLQKSLEDFAADLKERLRDLSGESEPE